MQQALLPGGLAPPAPIGIAAPCPPDGSVQYCGRVKSYNPKRGYGFLECPEARQHYGRDVFIHKAQMGDLLGRFVGPGTKLEPMALKMQVRFCVEMNKQGMPQARDVVRVEDAAEPAPAGDRAAHGPCGYAAAATAAPQAPLPMTSPPPAMAPPPEPPPDLDGDEAGLGFWDGAAGAVRGYKCRGGTIRIVPGTESTEAMEQASTLPQCPPPQAQAVAPAPQRSARNQGVPRRSPPAQEDPPFAFWPREEAVPRRTPPARPAEAWGSQEGVWRDFAAPCARQQAHPAQPPYQVPPQTQTWLPCSSPSANCAETSISKYVEVCDKP